MEDRGWDGWNGITNSKNMNLSKLGGLVMDREAWRAAGRGVAKRQTLNWTKDMETIQVSTNQWT